MTVEFHPLANQELADAARFYEQQALGLGTRFVNEVGRLLSVLTVYPELGRLARGGLRTISTRRFPYSLVYQIANDRLVVLAVAHHRRRPGYWAGRQSST